MAWYFYLFKNSPVCCDPHKDFSVVSEAEVDFFFSQNSFACSTIQQMLAVWSLVPLPFLNSAYTSGISRFMYC